MIKLQDLASQTIKKTFYLCHVWANAVYLQGMGIKKELVAVRNEPRTSKPNYYVTLVPNSFICQWCLLSSLVATCKAIKLRRGVIGNPYVLK